MKYLFIILALIIFSCGEKAKENTPTPQPVPNPITTYTMTFIAQQDSTFLVHHVYKNGLELSLSSSTIVSVGDTITGTINKIQGNGISQISLQLFLNNLLEYELSGEIELNDTVNMFYIVD